MPTCSINPVLACGSVINTPQASVFGPPNPLIGVGAFVSSSSPACSPSTRCRYRVGTGLA